MVAPAHHCLPAREREIMPRLDMLRPLIGREVLRLVKNPSALLMLGMLVAFSLLLALSRGDKKAPMTCVIVHPDKLTTVDWGGTATDFIKKLTRQAKTTRTIGVIPLSRVPVYRGQRVYPPNTCAIELLDLPTSDKGKSQLTVSYRHPGGKSDVLEPFLRWFWPIALDHFGHVAVVESEPTSSRPKTAAGVVMERLQSGSLTELMTEELAAAVLLLVIQFVTCCQLIVSFTSQDRERGTLTALALSPIRMSELLQAKILFHLALSAIGCCAVIAILKPAALSHASLWATLILTSLGLCGVGMVIASLARTQSAASLLALCYMLVGAVVFYLATKFSAFAWVKSLAFENYSFGMIFLSLQQSIPIARATDLQPMTFLVAGWLVAATLLFRARGWR